MLLGLRVAKAAHSASNGSATTAFVRLAIDGGGCGGELAGEFDEGWMAEWKGLRGGIAGNDNGAVAAVGWFARKMEGASGGEPRDCERA